jgi:hypothetical protein
MALVARSLAIAVALAGCYDPALRDCTVACGGSNDCAGGQECRAGTCVAEGAPADVCTNGDKPDSGMTITDEVPLHVMVNAANGDKGNVVVDDDPEKSCTNDCVFQVLRGQPHDVVANPAEDHEFRMWSGACVGVLPTCVVTPVTDEMVTVGAKFD